MEEKVIEAMKSGARTRDEIAYFCNTSVMEVNPVLARMYLENKVRTSHKEGWILREKALRR